MTALSTMLSVIMLPVNLIIYASSSYSSAVVKSLDWYALFMSLFVVIGGISSGLFCSAYFKDAPAKAHHIHKAANRFGNVAGICLITYSILVSSSDHKAALWDQEWQFFVGIATPAVIGITIATFLASSFKLDKPERVAVAVESCYQNTGIATSVAVVMFDGDKDSLAEAISVPLFYGMVEAGLLAVFCLICWKAGWTKAPADEKLCVILATSYECEEEEAVAQATNIDMVLGDISDSGESISDCEQGQVMEGGGELGLSKLQQPNLIFEETEASETAASDDPLRDPSAGPVVLRKAGSQKEMLAKQHETRARANTADDSKLARQQDGNLPRRRRSGQMDGTSSPQSFTEAADGGEMDGSGHHEAELGRLGKTISFVKARATGYRRAPLPDEDGHAPQITHEPPSAGEHLSAEITNQEGQYKDVASSSPAKEQSPPRSSNSDSVPKSPLPTDSVPETASPNAPPAEGKSID